MSEAVKDDAGAGSDAGAGAGGDEGSNSSGESQAALAEIQTRARGMGWSPKDQWRGAPDRWLDAPDFVRRGEELLPIVNAQNRSLREELNQTKVQLAAAAESIEALKEFNSKANRETLKQTREELAGQIKQAREDGDTKAELELTEKFNEAGEAIKESEKPKPAAAAVKPVQQETTPVFKDWATENPWFGTDEPKSDYAMGVAGRLRASQPHLTERAFLDAVAKAVNTQFPTQRRQSKVEGARGGNGGGGGSDSGKSYSDLPADAKAACDKDAKRLVGANRAFKTNADWQAHYVKKYFE